MKDFKLEFVKTFYVTALNEESALEQAHDAIQYELSVDSHTPHTFFDTVHTVELDEDDMNIR